MLRVCVAVGDGLSMPLTQDDARLGLQTSARMQYRSSRVAVAQAEVAPEI